MTDSRKLKIYKIKKERELAFDLFSKIDKEKAYSNIVLAEIGKSETPLKDEENHLSDDDHCQASEEKINSSFVRNLVLGTLENKLLLDYYIDRFLKREPKKKADDIRNILRLGFYQILFMKSGKDYAICNEMVNLTKIRFKGYEGLVNAILRNVIRSKESLTPPEGSDVDTLSTKYSIDKSIIALWEKSYGIKKSIELCEMSSERAPLFARVNKNLANTDRVIEILKSQDVGATKVDENKRAILIDSSDQAKAISSEAFSDGYISFQDLSSIIAVDKLGVNSEDCILDMCSAPGGKSVSAAEIANKGKIIAWDIYPHKIDLIQKYAKRCEISNLQAYLHSALDYREEYEKKFDKVILDPPCSGLGVMRRRPEIRYKSMDNFNLSDQQFGMLKLAVCYVKPGGSILYSTCTVNPYENDELIKKFLDAGYSQEFDVMYERQIFTGEFGADGFYICILKRRG